MSKIDWVTHTKMPILSVDLQPNGYRFVTGGSDHKVYVWNLLPVISEKYERLGREAQQPKDKRMRAAGDGGRTQNENSAQLRG